MSITRANIDGRDVYIADETDMERLLADSQSLQELLQLAITGGSWQAIMSKLEETLNGRNG